MKIALSSKLKSMMYRLREQSGIGLVEALVAIGILGVAVTAFVSDLSAGAVAVRVQNEGVIAQGLAQNQIEVIQAAAYDATGDSYPTIEAPAGYSVAVSTHSVYGSDYLQKITIRVTHGDEPILTLEDYKVDR